MCCCCCSIYLQFRGKRKSFKQQTLYTLHSTAVDLNSVCPNQFLSVWERGARECC